MKTSTKATFTREQKTLLVVLAFVQFIAIAEFMVVMPLAPILMQSFNFTPAQFGLIVSSYAFASGFSGLACAMFIDRFDRKHSLLFLFAGLITATFLCAFAWGYLPLLIGRVLAGIFSGVLGSQVQTVISETIEPERRGEAFGIVFAAFSLSTVVGVPLGLLLASKFYWGAPFIFLASIGVIVWFFGLKILPSITKHLQQGKAHPLKDITGLLTGKVTLRAFALTLLMMSASAFIIPFISPYLVLNLGVPEDKLFLVYLFGGMATFFTSRLIGRAADRYGAARTFRCVSIASLLPILVMTNLPVLALPEIIIVAAFFFVLVSGRMSPCIALLTQTIPATIRGRFLSVNSAVQNFALAFGSYGASLLISRSESGALVGFGNTGIVASAIVLLSCVWSYKIKKTT